jgi:hypothetical protein
MPVESRNVTSARSKRTSWAPAAIAVRVRRPTIVWFLAQLGVGLPPVNRG